jgi:HK97 family phage major capsid protein
MTITEQCDRLAAIKGEMEGVLNAAKDRPLSAEEATSFDALDKEADGLVEFSETARPGPTLESPPDATQSLRQLRNGTYRLRNLPDEKLAYQCGISFLARCGTGAMQDWAKQKCANAGMNLESLTPYQSEDGNVSGGYLVFPQFEATLINLKEQYGVLQREAFKVPMASDTLIIPRRAGGTTVYYPGENTQLTESSMKFDQVQLFAKKYAQMTRWSTELNEDSVIAMADLLAGEMAYQFAKAEDANGFNGDGTSTYAGTVGLLTKFKSGTNGVIPTASVVTATGHTTLGATTLVDWNNVVGTLPLYAEGRAKWYMHKTAFFGGIVPLIEAAGGNIANYLVAGAPLKFMGYDVVFCQAMPTNSSLTTATYGVVLGDMSITSYMGTRRGVTVRTSDQRYIEFDQIAIQSTQRVAINNVVGDSVAPTSVAGPMVCLKLG